MKRRGLFRATLLVVAILFLITACSLSDPNESQLTQNTNSETSILVNQERSLAETTPGINIVPGSVNVVCSAGKYWGFRGLNRPSTGRVLYDYAYSKMNVFAKVGYNIRLGLYEEIPKPGISVDDLLKENIDSEPASPKQLCIIYIGERNEASIYAGTDVPKIDFDAVKNAFQDESVTDPAMRVMIAILLLSDELISGEMGTKNGFN